MFKFLHAADVHLDSPLTGLGRYEGAPVDDIRQASRRALENLVHLAIDQQVAFVLIAGDLYDGDWRDFSTGLFFVQQMTKLRQAEIPVVMITGNHDAANKMTRSIRLPDNVFKLSDKKPECQILDQYDVAIHGQGFGKRAVTDNLASEYPIATPGMLNIGLLHTCATGDEGHEPYAPCTLDDLRSKEYDYWALGHIHQRRELQNDGEPPIVFPGNIQGRHARETGAKGCVLVTVEESRRCQTEFRALDVFRWSECVVDATGAEDADAVLDRFTHALEQTQAEADDLPLAVRVNIVGRTRAHAKLNSATSAWGQQLRAAAIDASHGRAWIEKIRIRTQSPQDADALSLDDGPIGELLSYFRDLHAEDPRLQKFRSELDEFAKRMPPEIFEERDGLRLDDPQWLAEVLHDVQPLLAARLGLQEGGEL